MQMFMLLTTALLTGTALLPSEEPAPFPTATPESQGMSSKNLQELAGVVRKLAQRDKIVGAELLVIKNRRVVLHEAVGMKDRENKKEMQPNTIFCVRSMTKPVNGVAVQMLIDEGKLSPDDLVSKYIPAFGNEKSKAITVKHLLTHTSGLPLSSSLKGLDYATIKSMRDIADYTGNKGPEFPTGSGFHYADDNSDTLGAIIMHITGKPAEQFIQERVLNPLGMKDSICVIDTKDTRLPRFTSAYAGAEGAWAKFWEPGKKPIFHSFLASQGLYATPMDYARFLAFLLDGGKIGDKQLLSKAAMERIMTPAIEMSHPHSFDGLKIHYGQQMMVYTDTKGKRVCFGHGGSDGTHAYAFPDQDLIVLYFTQSRGNTTFMEFEEAVQRHLLGGSSKTAAAPPKRDAKTLAPYLGVYWMEQVKKPVVVTYQQDQLWLEIPWQTLLELKETDQPDRWTARLAPNLAVVFDRDTAGKISSFTIEQNGQKIPFPRLKAEEGLPTVAELMQLRRKSLGLDKVPGLGVVRLTGTLERGEGMKGTFTMLMAGPTRYRWELSLSAEAWEKAVVDGEKAWSASMRQAAQELSGLRADQARYSAFILPLADWQQLFREVQVLKKIEMRGKQVFIVRCVPREAASRFFYVDAATGQLLADEHVEMVPGAGHVGKGTEFEDYRDVNGVQIPHKLRHQYASVMVGRLSQTVEKMETKVEAPKDAFLLKAEK